MVGIGQHFRRIKHLLDDGQVLRDARRSRLLAELLADLQVLSRRSVVCGIGGGRFFWRFEEFELGGVELLAALAEDAAAQRVDGLLEDGDLRVALRDLAEQVLPFLVLHLRWIP